MSAWAATYLAWHEREYPSSHYRVRQIVTGWLVPVFGERHLDELRRADAEEYKLSRRAAPGTVAKELRTLQALLNRAVEWEIIARNPLKGVRPPQDLDDRPPRYLTRDELARLYASSRYRDAWWRLLANTGLRRAEALQMQWDHVQGDFLLVPSTSEARTKSGRSRTVPLNKAAHAALAAAGDAVGHSRKHHAAYVLPRMYGRSLSRLFDEDAARAGITATLHDLRHTFCAQLVLAGVALSRVQQLAGHSTIRITERYARLLTTDLVGDVRRLEL